MSSIQGSDIDSASHPRGRASSSDQTRTDPDSVLGDGDRPSGSDPWRGLDAFRPVRLRKASDEVLAVLVDALRGGLYEIGEPFPPERDFALRLGISRKVLRDAIDVLRREGVVTVRRGSGGGIFVASLENLGKISTQIQGETRENLRSVLGVRRVLECYGASLAAERATVRDIAHLGRLVDMLPGVDDRPKEFWEVDMRFHLGVAEASRNPVVPEFLSEILRRLEAIRQQFPYAYVEHGEAIANQRETLAAIASGKPSKAAKAMDKHLASLELVLVGTTLQD
jgi:GntR family transcriptional repressor for pyruvate dehydrogenase complex